jgi:hypothetical protein
MLFLGITMILSEYDMIYRLVKVTYKREVFCYKVESKIHCDQDEENTNRIKEESPGRHVLSIRPDKYREYNKVNS